MSEVYRTPFTPPEGFPSLELPDDVATGAEADAQEELPSLIPLATESAKNIVNEPLPDLANWPGADVTGLEVGDSVALPDLTAPPSLEVASPSVDVELPGLELSPELRQEAITDLGEEGVEAAGVNKPDVNNPKADRPNFTAELLDNLQSSAEKLINSGSGDVIYEADKLVAVIEKALQDPSILNDPNRAAALNSVKSDVDHMLNEYALGRGDEGANKLVSVITSLHSFLKSEN